MSASASQIRLEPSELLPGHRLDRYELLCPVGKGGMASVWVARLLGKHGFEKLVAIKTILPHFAHDPRFHGMFLDEARIASRIQHVNVAQILDLGDQDGVVFLAMEWVEGDALSLLARRLRERALPFPPGIALRILADVCAGLHAAHELRDESGASLEIVHRDVSPHNILISSQGVAKIIDFGIAKARDRLGGDTETGSFKGKVRYVSPEQALSPRTADRRADIWSAGAVLYALIAGRAPYDGDNDVATLGRLASGRAPAPLPPNVPRAVRTVAHHALALRPQDRPSTAQELGRALERALLEMGLNVTTADVAAFCATHLSDRIEARRAAIAAAIAEAGARARSASSAASITAPGETAHVLAQAAASNSLVPTAVPPSRLRAEASGSQTPAAATIDASSVTSRATRLRWRAAGAAVVIAFALTAAALATVVAHRPKEPPARASVASPVAPAASLVETVRSAVTADPAPEPTPDPPAVVPASASPHASAPSGFPAPWPAPRRVPLARPVSSPPASPPAPAPRSTSDYGF